jgi:hypothetical protein
MERQWSADEVRSCVESSCVEQGVPVKVSDPEVLAQIAALLVEGRQSVVIRLARSAGRVRGRSDANLAGSGLAR